MAEVTEQFRYSVALSEGWYSIFSSDPGKNFDPVALTDSFQLDEDRSERMKFALAGAWQFCKAGIDERSERWVLIRHPEEGRVDAVLALDIHGASSANGANEYFQLARDGAQGGDSIEVINRTTERMELDAGSAIVVHDFALPYPDQEIVDPVTERAVAGFFLKDVPFIVEFSLVTQDLGLTDHIVEDLMSVVRTFRIASAK